VGAGVTAIRTVSSWRGSPAGATLADEPVVGAVFAAGKLMVALSSGPKPITSNQIGPIKLETTKNGATSSLVDRYRRIGWTELP
jgi:hypothetical protein